MLLQRYTPKYIILDVAQWFDYLYGGDDATKYLSPLKPYYDYHGIRDVFYKSSRVEAIKMLSWMYRYNTRIIESEKEPKNRMGFGSVHGYVDPSITIDEPIYEVEIDSVKAYFFDEFIAVCKARGIKLMILVSPSFKKTQTFELDYVRDLALKEDLPYQSFWADTSWVRTPEYFHDSGHMNEIGANEFSRFIVPLIRSAFNIDAQKINLCQ